jgi:hypothetical protein
MYIMFHRLVSRLEKLIQSGFSGVQFCRGFNPFNRFCRGDTTIESKPKLTDLNRRSCTMSAEVTNATSTFSYDYFLAFAWSFGRRSGASQNVF